MFDSVLVSSVTVRAEKISFKHKARSRHRDLLLVIIASSDQPLLLLTRSLLLLLVLLTPRGTTARRESQTRMQHEQQGRQAPSERSAHRKGCAATEGDARQAPAEEV